MFRAYARFGLLGFIATAMAGGCTSSKILEAYNKGHEAILSDADARLLLAKKVVDGAENTASTMDFIGMYVPIRCQNNSTVELQNTKLRINSFEILDTYLKTLQAALKPYDKAIAYVDRMDGLVKSVASVSGSSLDAALITSMSAIGKNTITWVRAGAEANELRKIQQLAQKNDDHVRRVVQDLAVGLVALNEQVNGQIKVWEQCEFELVNWLKDRKDSTSIELEQRYRTFLSMRATIHSLKGAPLKADDPIYKIADIHTNIARGTGDLLQDAETLVALLARFEESRKNALENFQTAIKKLEAI